MDLFSADCRRRLPLPFVLTFIPAGFPSPADGFVETSLDLNDRLIRRPAATFIVRISGDSMTGAGIYPGDLAVVDRSLTPARGDVVVAIVDGGFTAKFIRWDGPASARSNIRLEAANPAYPPIRFSEGDELTIFGVITSTIHERRRDP